MDYYKTKKMAQSDIEAMCKSNNFTLSSICFNISRKYGLSKKSTLKYLEMLYDHDLIKMGKEHDRVLWVAEHE